MELQVRTIGFLCQSTSTGVTSAASPEGSKVKLNPRSSVAHNLMLAKINKCAKK